MTDPPKIKSPRKYSLGFTTGFVAKWDLQAAFRELIQNFLDQCKKIAGKAQIRTENVSTSEVEIHHVYYKTTNKNIVGHAVWDSKKGELYLINRKSAIPRKCFYIGVSSKSDSDQFIGTHGEGLKGAIAVLARMKNHEEEIPFEIYQRGKKLNFFVADDGEINTTTQQKTSLNLESLYKIPFRKVDLAIVVRGLPSIMETPFKCSLFLSFKQVNSWSELGEPNSYFRIRTKGGDFLFQSHPKTDIPGASTPLHGKVYAGGLYCSSHEHQHQTSFGVDFSNKEGLSRDRNVLDISSYYHNITSMIEIALENTKTTELIGSLVLDEMEKEYCMYLSSLRQLPDHLRDKLADLFHKKHPGVLVLFSSGIQHNIDTKWFFQQDCVLNVSRQLYRLLTPTTRFPAYEEMVEQSRKNLRNCTLVLPLPCHNQVCSLLKGLNLDIDKIEFRETNDNPLVPLCDFLNGKYVVSRRALPAENTIQFLVKAILEEHSKHTSNSEATNTSHTSDLIAKKIHESDIAPNQNEPITVVEQKKRKGITSTTPDQKREKMLATVPLQNRAQCMTNYAKVNHLDTNFIVIDRCNGVLQDLNATTEIVGINLLHLENLKKEVNGLKGQAWFVRLLCQIHAVCEKHKKVLYDVKHSFVLYYNKNPSLQGFSVVAKNAIYINIYPICFEENNEKSVSAYTTLLYAHEIAHLLLPNERHTPNHGAMTEKIAFLLLSN